MGEQAEYLLNGDDCQVCGEYIGEGDGIPRNCSGCGGGYQNTTPTGRTEAQRARRRRQRQRRAQRQRQALQAANVSGWEKLSEYHYRQIQDGKRIEWWPSTGKWSIDFVMQTTKREG